jgi:predicted RNA-binding protein with PUA-like domain
MAPISYWLAKSEESDYAIGDLERDDATAWVGVRNYEARNSMRDKMKPGDLVLFYHSNGTPPGVAGVARVASAAYPDPTQFVRKSIYFDPASSKEEPRWWLVDLAFEERFSHFVSLQEIRETPQLQEMSLFKRNRLSIHPVTKKEFDRIRKAGRQRQRSPRPDA